MDFREVGMRHGLDWSGSGEEQVAGSCKRGNGTPGSMKFGGFLD
jgi:hypothetical protein